MEIYKDEYKKFERLYEWLQAGDTNCGKVALVLYEKNHRGLMTTKDIKEGEIVLCIPNKFILGYHLASESPIGKQMLQKNLKSYFGQNILFVAYILEERRKKPKETMWKPFFDLFPDNFNNFPLFYTNEELKELTGSPFLQYLAENKLLLEQTYELICKNIPEFKQYEFKEFKEVMQVVLSRCFGQQFEDDNTALQYMVPLADMCNHLLPNKVQTKWEYDEEQKGFVIRALRAIDEGEDITLCYGRKISNTQWFYQFGFVYFPNLEDAVIIKLVLDDNAHGFRWKKEEVEPIL